MYLVSDETIGQALDERKAIVTALDGVNAFMDAIRHSADLSDEVDTTDAENWRGELARALREYDDAIEGYAQSEAA